jgi:argininosuccinate lyase
VPFREAHEVVKLVLQCVENKCFLIDLSMDEFKQSVPFLKTIFRVLAPETAVHGAIVLEEQDLNKLRLPLKRQKAV